MKRKQTGVRREKNLHVAGKPKKEKAKGQCVPDLYAPTTQRSETEQCARGRKKKSSFPLSTPGMEHRCQMASRSGSHPSQNTFHHVCKNKFDRAKSSSRSLDFGSSVKSGCVSPVQSKSDSRGQSAPYYGSNNWGITHPASSYHGDDRGVSAYDSMLQHTQPFMKSGDREGELSSTFSVGGSIPWTYASTKRPGVGSYTQSKYAPSTSARSLAAIMAEYAHPQTKMDSLGESIFNASSNSITPRSPNYMSKNFTHNSSAYLTKSTSLQLSDSKSPSAYRFGVPRPRSASGYHSGASKFADYRDDMSTITLNAVRSDSGCKTGSTNFSYKPSSERKSMSSKFGMSGNTFGSHDIESILNSFRSSSSSPKTTYSDSSSQQGLTSYRRKYDSYLSPNTTSNDNIRHEFLPNRSNIGISHAYDFKTRLFDNNSSDSLINKGMSSYAYDDSENRVPMSKNFSSFMGNHWQTEKDRLNKIANIIGKSTYNSSKKLQ